MTNEEIRQAKEDYNNELDSIGYALEDRETPEHERMFLVERKKQIKRELQNLTQNGKR